MPEKTSSPFPPIGDYAIVGDCRTAALIARTGAVEWLCMPNIDSASVFGAMLDRERGGSFSIAMTGGGFHSRRYLGDTNILETILSGPDGTVQITDFMPISDDAEDRLEPERELVRIVACLSGTPEIDVVCHPRPGYGRSAASISARGSNLWVLSTPDTHLFLSSEIALDSSDGCLRGRRRMREGERARLSFSVASRDPAVLPGPDDAEPKLERTKDWWESWIGQCSYEGEHAGMVRRSLLTLKLLDFVLSGAVLAAATTSLPESIGAGRNWDYRYCWLRDASFTLRAFTDTGFAREGMAFFGWLMHATRLTQPRFGTLYDVFGRKTGGETELDHLAGYKNSQPVRIGNGAADQLQLDVYGALMDAATDAIDRGNELSSQERRLLSRVGNVVCDEWTEPDNGIWEVRGGRRHNTHSKVMCWSALNDLVHLADESLADIPYEKFSSTRDEIKAQVMERAWNDDIGSFVGAYDDDFVDATALLFPRCDFIAADDPRMVKTWERIKDRLDDNGWVRRYDAGGDDMQGQEGAFGICSFWAVDYLARAGKLDEARERLAHLADCANDVGLWSEEYSPGDQKFLGNIPQAFTHTGFVNAVLTVDRIAKGRDPDESRHSDTCQTRKHETEVESRS